MSVEYVCVKINNLNTEAGKFELNRFFEINSVAS